MSAVVAGVVPKTVPIHPVLNSAFRSIIQGSADQINYAAVGCRIEPQGHFFLLFDGFDKLFVIWYHNVDPFAFASFHFGAQLIEGQPNAEGSNLRKPR